MSELAYNHDQPGHLRELARVAFAWGSLARAAARHEKIHRAALYAAMNEHGVEKQHVLNDDGDRLGSVSWQEARNVAKVTDLDALVDWVEEHYPTEVHEVTFTEVQPAFLRKLLERATEDGVAVHRATGEAIPGITVTSSEPFIRITETRAAETIGETLLQAVTRPAITEGN